MIGKLGDNRCFSKVDNELLVFISYVMFLCVMLLANIPDVALGKAALPKEELRNGDLIWVRGADDYILYNDYSDEEDWYRGQDAFLSRDDVPLKTKQIIQDLTFDEFYERYFRDIQVPDQYGDFSFLSGVISVGHVALVEKDGEELFVVEAANPDLGVIRTSLENWKSNFSEKAIFWVGRFRTFDDNDIRKIVEIAGRQVGKPYNFWELNLYNDSAFYCSKLIWYSVMKAVGISLDGNPNADRSIWYSPKQMHDSDQIEVYYGPSAY